jgi:hypothetical protein
VVCIRMFLAIFHPPNRSKIREFTCGCSNPSIFREFKACKFLFSSQFLRNISIRIIFTIKRWYFKLEFMKNIIIVAYLTSSMAHPYHSDYAVSDIERRGHQDLNQQNTHPNCHRPVHQSCFCCYALDAGHVLMS